MVHAIVLYSISSDTIYDVVKKAQCDVKLRNSYSIFTLLAPSYCDLNTSVHLANVDHASRK